MRRAGCKGRRRRERPDGRLLFCVEGKRRRRGGEREGVCRSGRRRRNDETGSLSGRKGFWWEREREWCSGVVGEKKEADPRRAVFSSVELWGGDRDDDDYWTACRCLSYLINPTALHCTPCADALLSWPSYGYGYACAHAIPPGVPSPCDSGLPAGAGTCMPLQSIALLRPALPQSIEVGALARNWYVHKATVDIFPPPTLLHSCSFTGRPCALTLTCDAVADSFSPAPVHPALAEIGESGHAGGVALLTPLPHHPDSYPASARQVRGLQVGVWRSRSAQNDLPVTCRLRPTPPPGCVHFIQICFSRPRLVQPQRGRICLAPSTRRCRAASRRCKFTFSPNGATRYVGRCTASVRRRKILSRCKTKGVFAALRIPGHVHRFLPRLSPDHASCARWHDSANDEAACPTTVQRLLRHDAPSRALKRNTCPLTVR